jgi:hypothetical protein
MITEGLGDLDKAGITEFTFKDHHKARNRQAEGSFRRA